VADADERWSALLEKGVGGAELLEVVSSHDEVDRLVGRSDFLECAQARLDFGNRRDGREALACGGVAVALYVGTREEAPRVGLIRPALPLFDLAAECYRTSSQLRLDEVQEPSCRAIRGIRPRHIFAGVDDDGVIRKEKPSQWPSVRRGRALSAAKALGSR